MIIQQLSTDWQGGLTNIDGKACNNIQEAVNKFAWSAHLDNSFESMYKYQD
jgi:hypothetical protein